MRGSALVLVGMLAGCSLLDQRVVEVKVPVAVRAVPPPELANCTDKLSLPVFEACGPQGWSCLSPEQEARFRGFVHILMACDAGWRAWGAKPPQ